MWDTRITTSSYPVAFFYYKLLKFNANYCKSIISMNPPLFHGGNTTLIYSHKLLLGCTMTLLSIGGDSNHG